MITPSARTAENVYTWILVIAVILLILSIPWLVELAFKKEPAKETLELAHPLPGSWERWRVSYYSAPEHGRPTASGEIFDSAALTCASIEKIPFGTILHFVNPDNGRQVECRVTDRMPQCYRETNPLRKFDISKAAAESLGMVREGVKELLISEFKKAPSEPGELMMLDSSIIHGDTLAKFYMSSVDSTKFVRDFGWMLPDTITALHNRQSVQAYKQNTPTVSVQAYKQNTPTVEETMARSASWMGSDTMPVFYIITRNVKQPQPIEKLQIKYIIKGIKTP